MALFELARTVNPTIEYPLVGKGITIRKGEIVVRTTNATYTPATPVIRALLSGDTITAAQTSGIYGVALEDITTDSSFNVIAPDLISTVESRVQSIFEIPSMAYPRDRDPDTGYPRLRVAVFDFNNVFKATMEATDVADFTVAGTNVGIAVTSSTHPYSYVINDDAADANSPLAVLDVDVDDANFNSATLGGKVWVRVVETFSQYLNGGAYS